MEPIDAILAPLIPLLVLVHLLIAPYTKVEESFNIQATHDIVTFGFNVRGGSPPTHPFDHIWFPGAVPRTLVGALTLAGISKPFILLAGYQHGQFIARAVLGLFNAWALMKYKSALVRAYGKDVGRWYILLQATQFHVIFYASRTLPNMFAFGLTTLALANFLPFSIPQDAASVLRNQKLGIFLLVFSGVVFRSEIAVLLFTQLAYMLVYPRISLERIIPTGLRSAGLSLLVTFVVDTYFWRKPVWPEFAGFYFNAIQGKAEEWGTSPAHYYFTNLLPKLLLNPVILLVLVPLGFILPALKYRIKELIIPSLLFITIYSLQPHKEGRFIIYAVPPITAAASLSASYMWNRRSKKFIYLLGSLLVIVSIAGSFVASTGMLLISSLNYPGGEALTQLNAILQKTPWTEPDDRFNDISIHMDVLSCMTGVTRFLQLGTAYGIYHRVPVVNGRSSRVIYDKTEDSDVLHDAKFWAQFDYALMEHPELAIGKWEVIATVFGYAGIEFLRPGDGNSFSEHMERVYAANNITLQDQVEGSKEEVEREKQRLENVKTKLLFEEMNRFGTFNMIRDAVRLVTRGWWVGPKMEPKIRILKRQKD